MEYALTKLSSSFILICTKKSWVHLNQGSRHHRWNMKQFLSLLHSANLPKSLRQGRERQAEKQQILPLLRMKMIFRECGKTEQIWSLSGQTRGWWWEWNPKVITENTLLAVSSLLHQRSFFSYYNCGSIARGRDGHAGRQDLSHLYNVKHQLLQISLIYKNNLTF